jgi:multiple sugar transport system permease protein
LNPRNIIGIVPIRDPASLPIICEQPGHRLDRYAAAVILGSINGYAFARYRIGGSTLPFGVLSLKFFPLVAAIVPYFLMMSKLRIIDTRAAVIIPHLILTLPFAVWMIKGFIQEVPRKLEEAAMIDRCSH